MSAGGGDAPTRGPWREAFAVREERGRSYFTRVGVAFCNRETGSISVLLDAIPVNGKLVLLKPKPREQSAPAGAPPASSSSSSPRDPRDDYDNAPPADRAGGDDIPF